jgi:hypothetical protein
MLVAFLPILSLLPIVWIAAALYPIVCAGLLVVCIMSWLLFLVQTSYNTKINNNNDVAYEYYWQSAQCSGFLNNVLPEDGPVWSKHVAHKRGLYIYFSDILNILTNILVN